MKIFIIHASAGFGHKKIAESINETAVSLYGKESVSLLDVLDFTQPIFKFMYSKGYIFLITKFTWLWAIIFFLSDTIYLKIFNVNFRKFSNRIFCNRFLNFMRRENPEVIISTHFLVNELVSYLKERKEINSKLISIVTDFGVHNFWLAKNIDIYIAACDKTRQILASKQVSGDKIKVFGIPTRKQFLKKIDKTSVRKKLAINNDLFTAMILTGGIGIGPIYQIVKLLSDEVNVIVVCGKNTKLQKRLRKLNYNNLVVLGWIDYVEETMAVSDIIITKPGGSTVSECLVMALPMIFFSIIPGQEQQNAEIISNLGLGFVLRNPFEIKEKVLYFNKNIDELAAIKNKINSFKIDDSNHKILSLINE